MIDAISIAGFRGIEKLEIKELGRINVIIGRNDSGKTALMEALAVADMPRGALLVLQHLQTARAGKVPTGDVDGFWRPLFFRQDSRAGIHLVSSRGGVQSSVDITELATLEPIMVGPQGLVNPTWVLEASSTNGDNPMMGRAFGTTGSPEASFLLPGAEQRTGYWITPGPQINEHAVQQFSNLKAKRRDREIVDLLREIDERLTRIDILAPRGQVQLSVELEGIPQMCLSR